MLQKNRSGEVIEQTSNKKFVTELKLDHHEILSIFNIFWNVTKGAIDSTDTNLNHEFSCNLNLELDWRIIRLRATSIVKLTCLLYLVKQNFITLLHVKLLLTIYLKKFFVSMIEQKNYKKSTNRNDAQRGVYLIQLKQ